MTTETIIRLSFFIGVFALMVVLELIAPRRSLTTAKRSRWFSNLAITILNVIVTKLVFPIFPLALALILEKNNTGILNTIDLPGWLAVLFGVIILDFVIYLQHIMFHAVPVLWRLHMMHHTDLDYDVTTGLRFHPIEIILSMMIKLAAITLLGAPATSIIIFEILLNTMAMFNHGNIKIPSGFDRALRLFVVTPDMHRVHHSVILSESTSNYGFNLSCWDYLCGTYLKQPSAGHEGMTIGLTQFRDPKHLTLPLLLAMPFIGKRR